MAQEGPLNVSARGADDVNMGDEVAQRDISDAESISGDERRRNSLSDPTFREIEDHAPTRHASFGVVVCSLCARARSSRKTPGTRPQGT